MKSKLLKGFYNNDKRSLSRIMTLVDNRNLLGLEIMNEFYAKSGSSQIIGFTGPPGAGKSTLVNKVIQRFRNNGLTVGVIAVDPSSPYSNGALLGDRIRMLDFTMDEGVFIRSLASRGALGGLSSSTFDFITLLDCYGFDKIIVETVGAGQSEVDIVKTCDTTIVLTVPGFGDEVQILKAGIMEIADIFVVNKADKIGSKELSIQIKNMLHNGPKNSWEVPVFVTNSINGSGVDMLISSINSHWEYHIKDEFKLKRYSRFKEEILSRINNKVIDMIIDDKEFESIVHGIINGQYSMDKGILKILNLFKELGK